MPEAPALQPCRACNEPLIFALSDGGKWMPFNAKPLRAFNLRQAEDGKWHATATMVYVSHFATCPNAADFRKPK